MLTIHMKNRTQHDGIVSQLSLIMLFQTVQVHAGVAFIEPSPGTLLNLQHVERILEEVEQELTTEEATAALEDEAEGTLVAEGHRGLGGLHNGPADGCPVCSIEQGQPQW